MKKKWVKIVSILSVFVVFSTNVVAYGFDGIYSDELNKENTDIDAIQTEELEDFPEANDSIEYLIQDDYLQNVENNTNEFCNLDTIESVDSLEFDNGSSSIYNAPNIAFNQNSNVSWTIYNYDIVNYYQFVVTENGIVKFIGKKPTDSEGDIGRVDLTIYDANRQTIFNADGYYTAREGWGDYTYCIGLKPGVYYLGIKPVFRVTSGVIPFDFKLEFEANSFCELEPNETASSATPMELNKLYKGYFGDDGGSNSEGSDYYAVTLQGNKTYYLFAPDCNNYINTTTIIKMTGVSTSINYSLKNKPLLDRNGKQYVEINVNNSGTYYLQIYNYGQKQYEYNIGIFTKNVCADDNSTNDETDDMYYELCIGDSIECHFDDIDGPIKYSSEKRSVATVSSTGIIRAKKEGYTTIVVKSRDKTYYIDVNVIKPMICGHTSVMVGESSKLYVNGTDSSVKWKSSNVGIATVDSDGVITGMRRGSTTIYATIQGKRYSKKIKIR